MTPGDARAGQAGQGNGLKQARLLDGGPEAYPRMLAALARARYTVRLEVYAFACDSVGQQFISALSAAARRGVRVEAILDGWGSASDGAEVATHLRDAGCQVTIYNPLTSLLAGRFRRNHRKVLIVDDEVAFLGGINIGDEYGRMDEPDVPHWLDLAVELHGPSVGWLAARLRGAKFRPPRGGVRIHLSSLGGGRRLRRRYVKAIGAARGSVLVANAYFLPDRRLVRTITAAARRGVRVTLILPGRSDVPLAQAASRSLYGRLLRAGVRIHEWTSTVLHAKAAVMDGRRLLLGSFNLDPLSLANLETLVEIEEPEVAADAMAWMDRLIAQSKEITPEALAARPRLVRWILDGFGLLVMRVAHHIGRLLALR